jgi:hypothetical protein
MDPTKRITSEQAMQDDYFREEPLPTQVHLMILGEMVNLQKVNGPKSQLAKKVNLLKTPNIAFWLFYAQVDFLAS